MNFNARSKFYKASNRTNQDFENKNGPIVSYLFLVQVKIRNNENDTAVCCKMSTKDILFFSQHNKQRFNPM